MDYGFNTLPNQMGQNQQNVQQWNNQWTNPYVRQPNQYYQNPAPQPQQPQTDSSQTSGINWVLGEEGAKAFLVAPGKTVFLMDREQPRFYIKSMDMSGVPTLQKFRFEEIIENETISPAYMTQNQNEPDYITRSEFDQRFQELRGLIESTNTPKRNQNQKKEK